MYDWETLADGQPRRLYEGQDLHDAKLNSFRTMAHRKARELGLGLHTKINEADSSITIQFYQKY